MRNNVGEEIGQVRAAAARRIPISIANEATQKERDNNFFVWYAPDDKKRSQRLLPCQVVADELFTLLAF